ncbi:MAG: hypothetical protein ACRECH_14590, partial [Nitrososphaerales archaeon]
DRNADLSTSFKKFEEIRPKKKEVHVLVVPITEPTYSKFRRLASSQKLPPHDLIVNLMEEYVRAQTEKER